MQRYFSHRAGFSYRAVLVILALLAVCGLVAGLMLRQVDWTPNHKGPMLHVVKRGTFLHEILEGGEVESASNVELRCEVKARGSGGVTILWLIPEGTYVQPDDKLVVLDSSSLENEKAQQLITCSNSEAAVLTAENDLEAAEIAKTEYLKGTYVLNRNTIKNKIYVAQEAQRQAEQALAYSEELAKKGYVTELRVKTDQIAVQKAINDRESAELELETLDKYTLKKELKQIDSNISTVKASLNSAKATHKIDMEQLALVQGQIDKCTILSPESGQVVYASEFRRRGQDIIIEEGAQVREQQVIIRLPDPKRMQVKAKINEAKITLVEVGMPTKIRLDAYPDLELEGIVERVNEYPAQTSFWASNIKEYETFVKILNTPEGLKPGLNAEVRIQVELLHDVLQVPVQAVFEHGDKHYCVMTDGEGWRAQEVQIGSTNDKSVVIQKGLNERDKIVRAAFDYRDKVKLPKLAKKKQEEQNHRPKHAPGHSFSQGKNKAPGAQQMPKKASQPGDFFKKLDANSDGKISKNETPQPMKQHFSKLDKDSDGSISRSEWNAAAKMMSQQRPPGGAPPGGPRP